MEPAFEHSRKGFEFRVYPNRIVVNEGLVVKNEKVILLRNVTNVTVTPMGKLQVSTSDGARYEYMLGLEAKSARDAILQGL